ncbi:MAG: putative F420-dependent oxidoreductase [Gammaproteobacteria bacterium]|jgi:probable F420-dependent oxidoreductase
MKVGVMTQFGGDMTAPEYVARMGRGLEERGFHSVWAPDHLLVPKVIESSYPYTPDGSFPVEPTTQGLEPFTLLSFLAAHTTRLRLGTGVIVLPQRNAALTAKQAADVDVLSGGRLDFGIGVGWMADEFAALGMSFERRGARTDDYIRMMQSLWGTHESSYDGEFVKLPPAYQYPKPIQKPHPPFYFGGESTFALRRVARFGHWFGVDVMPEAVPAKLVLLKEQCDREGRDVKDVKIALCPYANPCDRDTLRRYEDAGIDQVIMAAFVFGQEALEATIDDLAERLIVPG